VYCAATAASILAVTLLLNPGSNLQKQTIQRGQPVQVRTRPTTVARRVTRQQRNLIRHNEAGAIRNLLTLFSAEATYQATAGNGDYGTIEELGRQKFIDHVLAEGHRYGYLFKVRLEKFSQESPASFEIVTVPRTYGRTGRRSFYVNETGDIHAADKKGAEANLGDHLLVIDP
jgi:hypothetical protein